MPKMKTHKASKKRFRVTATGKLKRSQAGKKHLNSHKTGKRKRHLAGQGRRDRPCCAEIHRSWVASEPVCRAEGVRCMVRARSGKTVRRGRKRHAQADQGLPSGRHNLYRQSLVTLIRGARLRLPRSPRPQARVPPAVDRPHQRRLPDARPCATAS